MCIDVGHLDNGSGMDSTSMKNKTKWNTSCHIKFNTTKLKRAEKRKHSMDSITEDIPVRKYINHNDSHEAAIEVFFLCVTKHKKYYVHLQFFAFMHKLEMCI